MATLIKVDGTIVEDIAVDTLAKQQHYVDGYIEYGFRGDKIFIMNEEGLLRSMPVNQTASDKYGSILVGDIVVADATEID